LFLTARFSAGADFLEEISDPEPSLLGAPVAFTASVAASGPEFLGRPGGTVQFAVDGRIAGERVTLDAKGARHGRRPI